MKQQLQEILKNSIKENFNIDLENIKLTLPPKWVDWDFSFNTWILARDLKKNPAIIAEDLKKNLEKEKNNFIEKIEVLNSFINFKLNNNIFTKKFLDYIKNDESMPAFTTKNKTIVIDYIGSNIWKPLHIGHMCSPNLGQVMINIYRKLGYNVIWDNHLWDWGIIFGKLIFAYKYFWENKEELEKNAIDYLLKLYVDITTETEKKPELDKKFRETFKELSSWDKEYIELWKDFTAYSVKDLRKQLKRLNVKPDLNIWESFYEWLDLPKLEDIPDLECDMKCVVNELKKKGIASTTDNEDWTKSVWVHFADEEKIPSCILQKRDWTHWYLASDLATIKYRMKNWNPDKIIYFVANEQRLHFIQLFNIAQRVLWLWKDTKLVHAMNWFISLKDWKMSTRKWRIIKLDKLLDEAEDRAKKIILEKRDDIDPEELENLSRIIWIWAIKYGYLKKNRETDVVFDWDEFMSFEGNSGPYIQYAYVRARRILEKWKIKEINENKEILDKVEEIELIKKILEYKNILTETTKNNYPHILAWYTYELTKSFNAFYNNVHILNEENEDLKNLRLKLAEKFSEILKESFELLWIEMPEKM